MAKKKDSNILALTEEERKQLVSDIQEYFRKERDENIGIIGSNDILDFFIEILGRRLYNKALEDVNIWYRKIQENIEADFYSLYKNI